MTAGGVTLALGCMNFGGRTPEDEARRVIDRALDAGVTVLDTANVYNDGRSEQIVGRALRAAGGARRAGVSVATKVGYARVGGKPEGLAPATIRAAAAASLERLGVDAIDIYYLHGPDRTTPIEESIAAIAELMAAGRVRAFGVSNFASWQILEIFGLCARTGVARPVISQVIYNVLVRQLEIEYLAFAEKYGLRSTVYNPLCGGLLARPPAPGSAPPPGSRFDGNKLYQRRYWTDPFAHAAARLAQAAAAHGRTPVELAYAWLAARPGVDSILVGPASVAQLDDAIAAVARPLPPELAAAADAIWRELVGTDASYAR